MVDGVSNNGHNSISYDIHAFAKCPCQSSIKTQSLVPLPLDLDWPCGLFWSVECSRNDVAQLLSVVLKTFAILFLLLRIFAPRSCPSKEAQGRPCRKKPHEERTIGSASTPSWTKCQTREAILDIQAQPEWETDDTCHKKKKLTQVLPEC